MRRRDVIGLVGGAATWPLVARAQQSATPVIGYIGIAPPDAIRSAAFLQGLKDQGLTNGQNVIVDYQWAGGRNDRLPLLAADLVARKVNVIATPGNTAASLAAKAATSTIPIIFGVAADPVKLSLVSNLGRPSENATGVYFFFADLVAKHLEVLHQLLPNARRIAVLINPTSPTAQTILPQVEAAGHALHLEIQHFFASSPSEVEIAFAGLRQERLDALFVAPDSFFNSRRTQLATLSSRDGVPTIFAAREYVEVGGLISYGPNLAEVFRQVGDRKSVV